MKSILQSLPPQVCERIANGKCKSYRRIQMPTDVPCKVYMCCTKSGMPIYSDGRYYVTDILHVLNDGMAEGFQKTSGFYKWNGKVIGEYICDKIDGKGMHISEVKIYDKPRELSEFCTICNKYERDACGDCPYLSTEICSYPCDDSVDTWCSVDNIKPVTRPPATFVYVEEIAQ